MIFWEKKGFVGIGIKKSNISRNLLLLFFCANVLLFFGTAVTAAAFKLPDTGQTKCYQGDSPFAEIPCAGTGQDGAYSINPLSYTDNGNATITDNNTGLMWQMYENASTYNWYQASGTYNAMHNPTSQDLCGSLNIGGYGDWRLPSKKELITIVDFSIPYPGPTIKTTYFPNTHASIDNYYWSSTTYWMSTYYASYPDVAWSVYFGYGSSEAVNKGTVLHVRCVRGEELDFGNFQDNNNGTVTDSATGLMWQQGGSGAMTWYSALSYCKGLPLGGYSDWRLPNIKELESLINLTKYPTLDEAFFSIEASVYWSSTTYALYPYNAWFVGVYYGQVYNQNKSEYVNVDARCVRGESGSLVPRILTVASSNPNSGVIITVSPNDNSGQGNGTTQFTRTYNNGTRVTLTTPSTAGVNNFTSWIGCDSTNGKQCTVTMNNARSVTASFTTQYPLNITKSGSGNGNITANAGAISWSGNSGTAIYSSNASVTLTASASNGSTFTSWIGCDSTNGKQCTVTMINARSVTASFTFNPPQHSLTISKSGTGTGGIASSPAGIDCGASCVASFISGVVVNLTAIPDTGSTFAGWSGGGCSGTGTCIITLNNDTAVTATFTAETNYTYTISPTTKSFKATGGNVTVKITGTGQNCPAPIVTINDAWLSQSGAMSWKNNAGNVKIGVQKNTSSQNRIGVLWIGGNALTIQESGAQCQLTSVKPSSGKFTNTGGTGSFDVAARPQDCAWNISTLSDWIHLDTLAVTGNGNVVFYIDTNATGKNRTGKIDASLATNVKKKKTFSLKQSK
jgi:hypothetical protein